MHAGQGSPNPTGELEREQFNQILNLKLATKSQTKHKPSIQRSIPLNVGSRGGKKNNIKIIYLYADAAVYLAPM